MSKKEQLMQKINELQSGWLRTQADFDNYKKKVEQDKEQWLAQAKEDVLIEILPILDNLFFAMQHTPQQLKKDNWVKGLEHISIQIENKLKDANITRIFPRKNSTFDPSIHEALAVEHNNKIKQGKIVELIRPGYKINERVIRPAQVKVSK